MCVTQWENDSKCVWESETQASEVDKCILWVGTNQVARRISVRLCLCVRVSAALKGEEKRKEFVQVLCQGVMSSLTHIHLCSVFWLTPFCHFSHFFTLLLHKLPGRFLSSLPFFSDTDTHINTNTLHWQPFHRPYAYNERIYCSVMDLALIPLRKAALSKTASSQALPQQLNAAVLTTSFRLPGPYLPCISLAPILSPSLHLSLYIWSPLSNLHDVSKDSSSFSKIDKRLAGMYWYVCVHLCMQNMFMCRHRFLPSQMHGPALCF